MKVRDVDFGESGPSQFMQELELHIIMGLKWRFESITLMESYLEQSMFL